MYCQVKEDRPGVYQCEACGEVYDRNVVLPLRARCRLSPIDLGRLKPKVIQGGPGTELAAILKGLGVEYRGGCGCQSHVTEMDGRGAAWCRENVEKIVGWMGDEAQERGWPFFSHFIARRLVHLAIRRAERRVYPTIDVSHKRSFLLQFEGPLGTGLGDTIQLSVVLQHLRALYPDVAIDVAGNLAKLNGFIHAGLCRSVYHLREEPAASEYDLVARMHMAGNHTSVAYHDSPGTNAEKMLRERFGITPRPELCSYICATTPEAAARAKPFIDRWRPFVLIHYSGHSNRRAKDIPEFAVKRTVKAITGAGRNAVVMDFDRVSTLGERPGLFYLRPDPALGPQHGQDAATIRALCDGAELTISCDSGPGKIFEAKSPTGPTPPCLAVWDRTHPYHYSGPADHVLHVVRRGHEGQIRGPDKEAGLKFFHANYRHAVLERNYDHDLPQLVLAALSGTAK